MTSSTPRRSASSKGPISVRWNRPGPVLVLPLLLACAALLYAPAAFAAAPIANPDGALPSQVAKVLASDGARDDFFGVSVAVSGDTMVVGAYDDDIATKVDQGSAYVFVRSGTNWVQQAKLTASDGATDDAFGCSVAIAGDTIVVGAYVDDVGSNPDQGSAYVFTRSGTTWTQQRKLVAADGTGGDCFGISVSTSGETAVVGAYLSDTGTGAYPGSAYVFTRSGATWTQQQKLSASDGGMSDDFGYAVAVSGDTAIIGAYYDDPKPDGARTGSAYIFVRSGTTWTQQAKLVASDAGAGDYFGMSVALSGDTALVGAGYDAVGANPGQGSAYVFTRSGATWSQQQKLTAADGATNDYFGVSVALVGDSALIGADGDDLGGGVNQGSAYAFKRSGTTWSQQHKLTASDGAAGDAFGISVALTADTNAVGAYLSDPGATIDRGSAYVFARYATAQDATLTIAAPGVLANDTGASSLTASLTAGPSHGTVTLAPNGGFVYTPAAGYNGVDTFTYRASDGGSFSAPASVSVTVGSGGGGGGGGGGGDTTPPTASASVSPSAWSKGPVTVTVSASDDSGSVTVTYSVAGGAAQPYSGSFTYDSEAPTPAGTPIVWTATDAVGNSASGTLAVFVDKSAPTLTVAASVVTSAGTSVTGSATDRLSGVASISHRVDSGAWITGATAVVSAPGTHTVTFEAKDVTGNASTASTQVNVPAGIEVPTALRIIAPVAPIGYGASAIVSGVLTNTAGVSSEGATITVERRSGTTWVPVAGAGAVADAAGRWSAPVRPVSNTVYRAVFAGVPGLRASASGSATVRVKAGMPVPFAAVRGRALTVSGRIRPAHAGKVRLEVQRLYAKGYRTYLTRYVPLGSGGTYRSTFTLPADTYRVRAIHEDSSHAKSVSGWRTARIR